MNDVAAHLRQPLAELLLSLADDKFILGHRHADWTGLAPILEEDIAFSSIAQEEIAHAAALYEIVAALSGGDPDALAYGRSPEQYRCAVIVELHDEFDFATAIVRQFFCDHFDIVRLSRLARSSYQPLAALAGRLLAEERIHVEHADAWIVRLGRGGADAHARVQTAIDRLVPCATMLFEPTAGVERLEAEGLYPRDPSDSFTNWLGQVRPVMEQAGFSASLHPPAAGAAGGRQGRHDAGFPKLLDELAEVYRVEPGAKW